MKKIFLLFNFCFLSRFLAGVATLVASFFTFYFLLLPSAFAAFFVLEPDSKTVAAGETFEVNLKVNTEGEQTTSSDAVLLFDQNILEASNVARGDFYPQTFNNISTDKVYVGGAVQNTTEFKVGEGTVATITFKGKAAGTSSVRFECTAGETSDSNISKNDRQATDIINCAKLTSGTYTITGSATQPTPKPTFGPTCSPSPQPSPTKLPEAGIVAPSILLLSVGGLLTILGFLFTL